MSSRTRNRKDRATRQRNHIKNFHSGKKKALPMICSGEPKKNIEDLTEYEIEQIWAEAVQIFKTEGFDPEQSEQEMEAFLQADPELREVSEILNGFLARKTKQGRKDLNPVRN